MVAKTHCLNRWRHVCLHILLVVLVPCWLTYIVYSGSSIVLESWGRVVVHSDIHSILCLISLYVMFNVACQHTGWTKSRPC